MLEKFSKEEYLIDHGFVKEMEGKGVSVFHSENDNDDVYLIRFHDEICAGVWFEATHGFQESQWLGNEVGFNACSVSWDHRDAPGFPPSMQLRVSL